MPLDLRTGHRALVLAALLLEDLQPEPFLSVLFLGLGILLGLLELSLER